MLVRGAIGWLCACLCACAPLTRAPGAAAARTPPVSPLRALHYTFSIDTALTRLSAQLCFEGTAPPRLVHGTAAAVAFVRTPRQVSEAGQARLRPLTLARGHIELDGLAADSCIAYDVDIGAALEHDSLLLAYPGERALLASAELFLWRPVHRPAGLTASVRFVLPDGVSVSTPWPERGGAYALDESAFACRGQLVFGHFARESVAVPGTTLDAVVLDGFPEPARGLIGAWLATAGAVASLPSGAFPVERAQVIVVPTSPSPFPIHFGYTGRSGGASIVLFMPTDMDLDHFRADWIAIHEFSHLLHPFVGRDDAWLSEGLATYLQEVLRVRAGLLPQEQAWRRLYEGALRGRETDQSLAYETRIMRVAGNYERVYWAGAAIALMADVELRRQTAGKVTLDTVLAGLTRGQRFNRAVSAHELLHVMDQIAGVPVFETTASRYMDGGGLPDLTELYRALGLVSSSGVLGMQDDAPLGWIRDAIMAERDIALPLPRSHS
jgi:hypothetical protein